MKPPLASDVLRRNAPRETIGQTFSHRNRYEKLRENSPAPVLRVRADLVFSQKRKVCDHVLSFQDLNAAKVSRVEKDDDEEVAKLESKMSKVGTMCGKLITTVQQLDMKDSLRAVIADLIETLRISNKVQEEVHNRYKDRKECSHTCGKDSQYVTMWDSSDFPVPTPAANTVSNNSRKKPSG